MINDSTCHAHTCLVAPLGQWSHARSQYTMYAVHHRANAPPRSVAYRRYPRRTPSQETQLYEQGILISHAWGQGLSQPVVAHTGSATDSDPNLDVSSVVQNVLSANDAHHDPSDEQSGIRWSKATLSQGIVRMHQYMLRTLWFEVWIPHRPPAKKDSNRAWKVWLELNDKVGRLRSTAFGRERWPEA
eukprot:6214377-Pleurochrysis_carterae.AAC.1